jgi:hypothetical protein
VLPAKRLRAKPLANALHALSADRNARAQCTLLAGRFSSSQDASALCLQMEAKLGS